MRQMVFVDGENLAIRYGKMLEEMKASARPNGGGFLHVKDAAVWSSFMYNYHGPILRTYFYTAVLGNDLDTLTQQLKDVGIEAPRVFKRHKTKGSKRVDITLATDMLRHATRKNLDVA